MIQFAGDMSSITKASSQTLRFKRAKITNAQTKRNRPPSIPPNVKSGSPTKTAPIANAIPDMTAKFARDQERTSNVLKKGYETGLSR